MIFVYGLAIIGVYLSLYVIYSQFLIVVNILIRGTKDSMPTPRTRFAVVIPAHNEELLLPRLLKSLEKQEYPEEYFDIMVVADNCVDKTCSVASSYRTLVIERHDRELIGKGYAIKFAFDTIPMEKYGAVFIVDADSLVEKMALRNLDEAIQAGARAIQCYNGLANPDASWFTRLLDVSRTLSNEVFEPAKEKLGLSSHLMGNGMCFTKAIMGRYGWRAFSVGEDWEYSTKIILQGERIAFANKVRVHHQESVDLRQATPQRLRWSSGRFSIASKYGVKLLLQGVKRGSILKIDAALPLLFPNPSFGISLTVVLLLPCLIFSFLPYRSFFIGWFGALAVMQLGFFLTGVMYTKDKAKNLMALFFAPTFLVWKSVIDLLSVIGVGRRIWVRTERKL
jgi:1,2-diacylglycerol 3-beta-glucosyltransferase